jgi:tetratricopeptide (TPR) repeat protein
MAPRCRKLAIVAATLGLSTFPILGQTSSGSTSGGGSSPSRPTIPSVPTSGSTTPTTLPSSTNTTQTPSSPPLRVSGRVMVDDGSPISFPATIERVCAGNPHAEGYTDAQGYFSLVLGQATDVIADASETPSSSRGSAMQFPGISTSGTGLGNNTNQSGRSPGMDNRITNCELRANLGGYTSKTINLTGRTSMDNPDVGTILIHRMGESDNGTTVTATTLKAPKEARRALQKGLELAKKNKPEEAIASLQEAVKVYPQFAYAWFELGKLQVDNEHTADGHESFEAAIKFEPRWPEPYMELALMGVKAHDWREVAETTDRVVHLNSFEFPQAYFLNGAANFNLHHVDIAERSALAAEKVDTQHLCPQIEQLLGTIYVERRKYPEAVEKFRSYLMLAPNASDAQATRQQVAVLEKILAQASQVAQKAPQQ